MHGLFGLFFMPKMNGTGTDAAFIRVPSRYKEGKTVHEKTNRGDVRSMSFPVRRGLRPGGNAGERGTKRHRGHHDPG